LFECQNFDFMNSNKSPNVGDIVECIISSYISNNRGINVKIGAPELNGTIDGLELSKDINNLSNLKKCYQCGNKIEAKVIKIDKLSKKSRLYNLSVVSMEEEERYPEEGDVVIGRVNRHLENFVKPSITLNLVPSKNIFGRCCITELRDVNDWISNPMDKFRNGKYVKVIILSPHPKLNQNKKDKKIYLDCSLRPSRVIKKRLQDDEIPKEHSIRKGYVNNVLENDRYFIKLARFIEGSIPMEEGDNETLESGQLVTVNVGKGYASNKKRKIKIFNLTKQDSQQLEFDDVELYGKYDGEVTIVESYGVFVRILNSKNVSGLVYISECSDQRHYKILKLEEMYQKGDLVKLYVIKIEKEKRKLCFSLKSNHFNLEEDDSSFSSDSCSSMDEEDDNCNIEMIDTNFPFEWGLSSLSKIKYDNVDDKSIQSDEEGINDSNTPSKRKKTSNSSRFERELSQREAALADGTADLNPETAADFERLVASEPNLSQHWIKYMAFQLSTADIEGARRIANRALERIDFRKEGEKLNVWTALLTLENKYAPKDSFENCLKKACQYNNPKQVYVRVCEMCAKEVNSFQTLQDEEEPLDEQQQEAIQNTDELFLQAVKKFKYKKTVWIAYFKYLIQNSRQEEAHNTLKQAIQCLPTYKHVQTVSKSAQLEYEYGSFLRGRLIFENLMDKYSKRVDLFFIWMDQEVKFHKIEKARSIIQQVIQNNNIKTTNPFINFQTNYTDKQMKQLFRKWFRIEEVHGNTDSQQAVKHAAKKYIDRTL